MQDIPLDWIRQLMLVSMFGAILLFFYQLTRLAEIMRRDDAFRAVHHEKALYVAIVLVLPLGLGAWIYDYVVNRKWLDPLFAVALLLTLIPACVVFMHFLPHMTEFNFDFLSW